ALHIVLIKTKGLQVHKKTIDQYYPKCGSRKIKIKTSQTKLTMFDPRMDNPHEATVGIHDDDRNDNNTAQRLYDSLYNFCPDHGFYPTQYRIKNDTDTGHNHNALHIKSCQCLQTQRYSEKNRSHPSQLHQEKTDNNIYPRPGTKPMF